MRALPSPGAPAPRAASTSASPSCMAALSKSASSRTTSRVGGGGSFVSASSIRSSRMCRESGSSGRGGPQCSGRCSGTSIFRKSSGRRASKFGNAPHPCVHGIPCVLAISVPMPFHRACHAIRCARARERRGVAAGGDGGSVAGDGNGSRAMAERRLAPDEGEREYLS